MGRRTFELTPANVHTAVALEVITLEPDTVRISLRKSTGAADPAGGPKPDPMPR